MAELKERGLRRSRSGTPGLFATAYGNVGSSIYYALGLVAAHALGLTPVVFIFAGGLFALTAKTYAEGASMFPEAGGSSSFARHAFNEVVSFFAGWGLSLDYIITVAISAFFVPHYLGAFCPGARPRPGGRRRRRRGDRDPRRCSTSAASASRRSSTSSSRSTDLVTQVALVVLGAVARPRPVAAGQPGPPRGRAELHGAALRPLDLDDRLHRDRDRLEHGRGGARPGRAGAAHGQLRPDRGARDLRRASRSSRSPRCR